MGICRELKEGQLRGAVERLTDENQSYLLEILEALFFLQNERDISDLEPETAQP